jgi:hypothetical protein
MGIGKIGSADEGVVGAGGVGAAGRIVLFAADRERVFREHR